MTKKKEPADWKPPCSTCYNDIHFVKDEIITLYDTIQPLKMLTAVKIYIYIYFTYESILFDP